MKRILTALFSIIFFSLTSCAQNAKVDKSGNYVAVAAISKEKPTETGKTFTDSKGKSYPVYKSANGKLFILRTSEKTGNEYKMYLKID